MLFSKYTYYGHKFTNMAPGFLSSLNKCPLGKLYQWNWYMRTHHHVTFKGIDENNLVIVELWAHIILLHHLCSIPDDPSTQNYLTRFQRSKPGEDDTIRKQLLTLRSLYKRWRKWKKYEELSESLSDLQLFAFIG